MLNALLYGIAAALGFIGFVCVTYYIVLCFCKSGGNASCVVKIPKNSDVGAIEKLIYSAYLKKNLFGDLIFDNVVIDDSELDESGKLIVEKIQNEMNQFYQKYDA